MRSISFILCTFLGLNAFATSSTGLDAVMEMQDHLERRLKPVVKELDPHAMVYVNIKTEEAVDRVSAPYFLGGSVEPVDIAKVTVIVFTERKSFPPSFKRVVRELAGNLAEVTSIKVKPLPKEFAASREALAKLNAPPVPVIEETTVTQRLMNNFRGLAPTHLIGIVLAVLVVLSGLMTASNVKEGTKQIHLILEKGLDRVATSFESRASAASAASAGGLTVEDVVTEVQNFGAQVTAHNPIAEMSDEGISALLSDCYWGEFDSYGAYVWNRIPMARRNVILSKQDFLPAYASQLGVQKEDNYSAEQEPYYLNPLPLCHIGNERLTELARSYPGLLFRLPPLRLAGLKMENTERMNLTRQALSDQSAEMLDFTTVEHSPHRNLGRRTLIPLVTDAEELAMLEHPDLSLEIVGNVPSLGWFLKLPETKTREILTRFTAKELASAWVGPLTVLAHLEKLLAPKKWDLIVACRKRFGATRQSPTFAKLHQLAYQALKESNTLPATSSQTVEPQATTTPELRVAA